MHTLTPDFIHALDESIQIAGRLEAEFQKLSFLGCNTMGTELFAQAGIRDRLLDLKQMVLASAKESEHTEFIPIVGQELEDLLRNENRTVI